MKVSYELRQYLWCEEELDAETVAQKIGMPASSVFKTLVARGDRAGVILACVPADCELDLKKLAAASGNKKVELVAVREIQSLTGYVRGGVSPLGVKKQYPVYLDVSAFELTTLSISAGVRGVQVLLSPGELQRLVGAHPVDLSRNKSSRPTSNQRRF